MTTDMPTVLPQRPLYRPFGPDIEILDAQGMTRVTNALERHPEALQSLITHPRPLMGLRTPAGVVDPRHADLLARDPDLAWVPAAFRIGQYTYGVEGTALTVTVRGVTRLVAETDLDLPWAELSRIGRPHRLADDTFVISRGGTSYRITDEDRQLVNLINSWKQAAITAHTGRQGRCSAATLLFPELEAVRSGRRYVKGGALKTAQITQLLTRGLTPDGKRAALALLPRITQYSWAGLPANASSIQLLRRLCGPTHTSEYLARISQTPEALPLSNPASLLHPLTLNLHRYVPGPVNQYLHNELRDCSGLIETVLGRDLLPIHAEVMNLTLDTQLEKALIPLAGGLNPRYDALLAQECAARNISTHADPGDALMVGPAHWEADFEIGGVYYSAELAVDQAELTQESRALHHCVQGMGYVRNAQAGRIHLLLVRTVTPQGREPHFTAEVNVQNRRVAQARGKYNRALTDHEQAVMHAWSALSGVQWSGDQPGADVGGTHGTAGDAQHVTVLPFSGVPAAQRAESSTRTERAQLYAEATVAALARLSEELGFSDEERQRLNGAAVMHLTRLHRQITRILDRVKPNHVGLGAADSRFEQGHSQFLIGGTWRRSGDVLWSAHTLRLKDTPYGPVLSGAARSVFVMGTWLGRPEELFIKVRFTQGLSSIQTGVTSKAATWRSYGRNQLLDPVPEAFQQTAQDLSARISAAGLPVRTCASISDLERLTDLRPSRLPRSQQQRQALADAWTQRKTELELTVLEDGTLSGPNGPLKAITDGPHLDGRQISSIGHTVNRQVHTALSAAGLSAEQLSELGGQYNWTLRPHKSIPEQELQDLAGALKPLSPAEIEQVARLATRYRGYSGFSERLIRSAREQFPALLTPQASAAQAS